MAATSLLTVALLTVLGLLLIFCEVFIPSFGLLTAMAVALFGVVVYTVSVSGGGPVGGVVTAAVLLGLVVMDLIAAFRLLPRSPLVLRDRGPAPQRDAANQPEERTGVAHTALRPAGKVRIRRRVYDAASRGDHIEKGTPVEVVDVRQGRVIVRRRT